VKEPLPPSTVKRLLVAILANGVLSFTKHAYEEMAKDKLTEIDVVNTLRAGVASPGELERGTYRYRVSTSPHGRRRGISIGDACGGDHRIAI
jgi:hypothetical protein